MKTQKNKNDSRISRNKRKLEAYSHLSPKLSKNALLICANESYQRSSEDLRELTGIKISHSTLQRLVNKQEMGTSQMCRNTDNQQ